MSSRWPIFVGIAAIAGGVAWFALRSDPPAPEADAGSQGSAALTAPKVPSRTQIAAPQPPTLGGDAGPGPHLAAQPTQTAEAAFSGQARDADWAPATETEIRKRFQKVRGAKLQTAECREDRCQLVVAGTEADVSQTIADLESDRGLHGFATNILLTAPERKPDGSLVLRAFAVFER